MPYGSSFKTRHGEATAYHSFQPKQHSTQTLRLQAYPCQNEFRAAPKNGKHGATGRRGNVEFRKIVAILNNHTAVWQRQRLVKREYCVIPKRTEWPSPESAQKR